MSQIIFRPVPLSRKIAVVILLVSMFANTTLAAPETTRTIVVTVDRISHEISFSLASFHVGAALVGWANNLLLFFRGNHKASQLSRIEIVPGDGLAIRQGEPKNFTAMGYTADNVPVSGLKFDWTIEDTGRETRVRNLPNGKFLAEIPGTFVITARSRGYQAQINITVEENRPLMMMKRLKRLRDRGDLGLINELRRQKRYSDNEISSKKDYRNDVKTNDSVQEETPSPESPTTDKPHGPNAGEPDAKNESLAGNSKSRMRMRPAGDGGWNNNNWWMADDPGNQIGNPPGTSPDTAAGNGNFQFSAPVASIPGRGIDLSLSLNYNSRVWSKAGSVMSFDAERGFPAPGWNLGFGKMMFMGTGGGCMMIDADGTNHAYTGTISNYSYGGYSSTSFSGHTSDGTFIDYNCYVSTYSGVTSMGGSSSLPNGTTVAYYVTSTNGKQAFPVQITDAQGNYVTITYVSNHGPSIQTVTDTMGRVVTFNYDSSNRLISVDVPKMDNAGTRTAVRLHYKSLTLNPGWASGTTGDTNNASPDVIDGIYYPGTNTGYWFDDTDSYSPYGMISKVLEQRGMSWSGSLGDQGTVTSGTMSKQAVYNYPSSPDYSLTDSPTYTTLTESWAGMDTDPAVTSYSVNNSDYHSDGTSNSPSRTITVTQPNGVISKQYSYRTPGAWTDGLIFSDETIHMNGSTPVILSSSLASWQQGNYDSPRPSWTQTTDELGQILKTTYSYTQPGTQQTFYNQLTSQKQYDYDGTTLLKEARNAYENNSAYTGRHIFSLVKTAEIYDGAGNRVSKTDYEYDDNAIVNGTGSPNLKATSGVTMHSVSYDQYTTETQQGPNCLEWAYGDPYDPYGSQYCVQWDTISAYDPNSIFRGNLTKTTVYSDAATPSGAIAQTKQYDVTGNLVAESASCCELKTYDYTLDTQFAYPTTQTRGSSDSNSTIRNTSTSVYDFNTGLIKQSTDPNGRTSSTTYDADTLRPTVSTSSTGAYTQTTYDEAAMTITDEVKDSSGVRAGKTKRYLNGLGLVKQEDSFGPSDVVDSVQTKYNQLAEVWKTSRPYRTCDTPQFSEKFYDVLGRVTKIVGPDGSETKAFYNETSRPDSASTLVGNTIRVMDAWGRERWGRFNAQQRLAEVVEPNPSGNGSVSATGSMVTNYTYDTMDRLTQTSQGSQLRKFKYDSLGRITRQKLAEQAATLDDSGAYVGSGSGTWSSAAVYDNRSNLTQRTDARGVRVNYSFQISGADDSLNRIQSISYDLTGTHDTTNPIPAAPTVSYEYMTTGDLDRVKKVTSSGISTDELTYDVEGRVTDQTKTILSRTSYPMATSFTYDTLSRVTQVLDPVQYGQTGSPRRLIQNSYDAASRLTGLVVNGQRQAGDIIYNAADQTTSINIGTSGTNQINEQYTFDSQTGLLTNQKAIKNGTATLLDLSYDYNRNNSNGTLSGKTGHLTRVLDNLNHDKDREYQFDALGRLTMAKGKASNQWTQTYVYDRYGNRTSVTATGTAADNSTMPADGIPNLAFNSANNRITTSGFQYDLAGNQIRALAEDGTTWLNFEYDAANRLVNIKQDNGTLIQNQLFGVGNERLALIDSSSNQTTYYDGSVEYVEYSGNGVLVWSKSTVYLGDSELSTITPDGSGGEYTEFEHPDRLGTRLKTNQSGGTSYEQAHLPFGKALNAESSMTTSNKRFTSYDRSAATGLDYAQNRTYDSKQGRFTQVDPSGMGSVSLAAPQTLNLYAYCANDPINHVDPSGLGFFSFLKSLFSWVGKILKWIAIAVAIAVVVVAIVLSPQTALLLVKAIVGFIGQIMGITVTNAPVLIMDFSGEIIGASVSTSISIGISSYVVAGFFAVGAVSSFAQTRDRPKNKETSEQRRKRVILRSINSALWRLRHMKGCKEFIQGSSSQDPVAVLKGLKKEKNIFYDPSLGLGKNDPVAQTVDLTGEPNFGQGVNSHIHLGRKFFTSTVGDWVGTMNVQNTRTNTVLHELKHAVDNQHLPGEADDYYYNEIAKKCFGVTP